MTKHIVAPIKYQPSDYNVDSQRDWFIEQINLKMATAHDVLMWDGVKVNWGNTNQQSAWFALAPSIAKEYQDAGWEVTERHNFSGSLGSESVDGPYGYFLTIRAPKPR